MTRYFVVNRNQLAFNATGDPQFDGIFIEHNGFAGEAGLVPEFVRWFANQEGSSDELLLPGLDASETVERTPPSLRIAIHTRPAFAVQGLDRIAREGLAAALSRNSRQQLGRSLRAYERTWGPLRLEAASDSRQRLAFFDGLKTLHRRSWARRGKSDAFSSPNFEEFHRELILKDGSAVQLLCVCAGQHVAGYIYNFRHGATVYAYQSGFADGDPNLHPGYVCHALAIEHSARQGAAAYDFMAGDNRLKRSFSNCEYSMYWVTCARPLFAHLAPGLRRLRGSI